jgi:hypothetical protein
MHPRRCRWWKRGAQAHGIGRSKGGSTTKIHASVDALGNPLCIEISGGQVHDSLFAEALLAGFDAADPVGPARRGPGSESVQKIAPISRRSTVSARAERLIVRAVRSLISWANRASPVEACPTMNASIRVAVIIVSEKIPSIDRSSFVCVYTPEDTTF